MYVIEVIPLKRGIFSESLSYYSAMAYQEGAILTIPLRNKKIQALVVSCKSVSAAKTALKTATFSLRRLEPQHTVATLPSSIIETAKRVTTVVPASLGSVLFAMLPSDIRGGTTPYPKTTEHKGTEDPTPRILTDTAANRYIAYRSHIRQTFAHRGSVLFIVPTSSTVEEAKLRLQTGIENRVITFSAASTKKQLASAYEQFEDLRHAKLIIATPSFAFLTRHDITTIIIESCGNEQYHQRTRPYLDIREVLKIYAKETGRSLLMGDLVPRTEEEIKRRDDLYATYEEHTKRLELPGNIVVAMHKRPEGEDKFALCTEELIQAIDRTLASKGRVFLHAARRGLAPVVICYDCGHIFRCPDSGAPYSLLRTFKDGQEQRWFYSVASGKRVRASDVCEQCGSWRLREQGIGIQQVHDHVRSQFPKAEIFLFDHTTATTHGKARKIVSAFYATTRSILIGTNMALPYLTEPVEVSSVVSYEAAKATPTWRADERLFSLLMTLRELTLKDVVVQIRNEADDLLDLARRGLLDQFYDGEIQLRKALGYPPHSTFILLSWLGSKEEALEVQAGVEKALSGVDINFYSAPQSSATKMLRHGLIRIPTSSWPDAKVLDGLKSLPPYIKIELDPDRIV